MTAADRAGAHMVDALCAAGRIRSPAVERAFRSVPRHVFLPSFAVHEAYADDAIPIRFAEGAATSSASQPSMMAIMLEQLELRSGQRVLEIGAGTGYNAALMATVVGREGLVVAVDIDQELIDDAAAHLAAAGPRLDAAGAGPVELVCADGALGHPERAPYDRIVLTVGSDDVRPEWLAQLAEGGRLLLPLAVRGSQLCVALDLGEDGVLRSDSVQSCMFIRLRGIGSATGSTVVLGRTDLAVEVPSDGLPADPDRLLAALVEPGEVIRMPFPLRQADIWDGFGLWLALTEPGACRLVAAGSGTPARAGIDLVAEDLLPVGSSTASLALVTSHGPVGLALVVQTADGRQALRCFGPAGVDLAAVLVGSMQAWAAVGRPGAPDWRLTVVPGGTGEPGPGVVPKPHATVLAEVRSHGSPAVAG
ncbi:methyltransferase domain-containing protein [Pseudonocardia humida]|uniref:Protein-L-isoaspartate O-methyltransferase n=1 Tax=Pseudonocardia humida TaxID=2800819 RepID=A0ABT1A0P5_9PSEU|nr:methyltransferase domain-containing protein [Pseudonocardia humida]MCO1656581.1 methyltransferase domain-containing protein [Pseudonocardia humida]